MNPAWLSTGQETKTTLLNITLESQTWEPTLRKEETGSLCGAPRFVLFAKIGSGIG